MVRVGLSGARCRVVGHVMFSRLPIHRPDGGVVDAVALGPLSVHPDAQRRGVGSNLTRHALDELRRRGETFAVVLGHPTYYPRFGFAAGAAAKLQSRFKPHTEGAFMAL